MNQLLNLFEWHDLPVKSLTLSERGVSLVVAPFDDVSDSYDFYHLKIEDAASFLFDITGDLSPMDLISLEIFTFDYETLADGRLDGSIGILPGNAGYWSFTFRNAAWSIAKLDRDGDGKTTPCDFNLP